LNEWRLDNYNTGNCNGKNYCRNGEWRMTDLKKYDNQTISRLIIGGIIILFLVGDGLIFLIYGQEAAMMGLLCLIGGLVPMGLIIGVIWLMDWVVKRAKRNS